MCMACPKICQGVLPDPWDLIKPGAGGNLSAEGFLLYRTFWQSVSSVLTKVRTISKWGRGETVPRLPPSFLPVSLFSSFLPDNKITVVEYLLGDWRLLGTRVTERSLVSNWQFNFTNECKVSTLRGTRRMLHGYLKACEGKAVIPSPTEGTKKSRSETEGK